MSKIYKIYKINAKRPGPARPKPGPGAGPGAAPGLARGWAQPFCVYLVYLASLVYLAYICIWYMSTI